MEHYFKGENIEKAIELKDVPFSALPTNIQWIKVRPGSKMRNLIDYALKSFNQGNTMILWTGIGPAIGKTISCVEIVKRRCDNINQITKINYHKCEELWRPKLEGLDTLKVVRNIPSIHVLLSSEPLDPNDHGFQALHAHKMLQTESNRSAKRESKGSKSLRRKQMKKNSN